MTKDISEVVAFADRWIDNENIGRAVTFESDYDFETISLRLAIYKRTPETHTAWRVGTRIWAEELRSFFDENGKVDRDRLSARLKRAFGFLEEHLHEYPTKEMEALHYLTEPTNA